MLFNDISKHLLSPPQRIEILDTIPEMQNIKSKSKIISAPNVICPCWRQNTPSDFSLKHLLKYSTLSNFKYLILSPSEELEEEEEEDMDDP